MKMKFLILTLVLIFFSGCEEKDQVITTSPLATDYLEEIMEIMQTYSIHQQKIDWEVFRNKVLNEAEGAQTIADTYPSIRLALSLLDDQHSIYVTAEGQRISDVKNCPPSLAAAVPEDQDIGYIKVSSFGGSEEEGVQFAQAIQDSIKAQDHEQLKGWIVDLRGNGGGNMWPMLAGIGPILGEGLAGYFINPDGTDITWTYENGKSLINDVALVSVNIPYTLRQVNSKVAVLTDESIASSGEAIVIAFKKRPNTRSFGYPTCGLSTANSGFEISDGARLYLTIATMADRNKEPYGSAVPPDELLAAETAVERAIAWLKE
ncbi:S41 family peptidase [Catalinimonas niigatensis]|uniref:S41 family peptidase n=1 Tax=Catalinimonas niigatensis TaxID=1397264 RepID=UPI0026671E50|nr:S41 family peptidase [Catalinimonas niigatensis]WPP52355.1 S41 family peptidase [Catalinimonas niigatensis]